MQGGRGGETQVFQSCENDRLQAIKPVCATLLPKWAIAPASWALLCPCPSAAEHGLAQEALGTSVSADFLSFPVSVFFPEPLGYAIHSFSWPKKCT